MTKQERERCISKTEGKIISFQSKGLDFPNIVRVIYVANGKTYALEESLQLKSSPIKLCGIVVGQKKTPVIDVKKGVADVLYDPSNPHFAYLIDNVGSINI